MNVIGMTVAIGLGDLIYIKSSFDAVKNNYSQIKIRFNRSIIGSVGRSLEYNQFLDDIGQLFFSQPPYVLCDEPFPYREGLRVYTDFAIKPQKPELGHLLCKGTPLNLDCPYIVMTTKLRYFERDHFNGISPQLWSSVRDLATTHKIVVLGEREVEMNGEYQVHTDKHIYSIYNDIKNNVPADRLVDLTFPALGITSPKLSQVQQDCLIMRDARLVITLGVGGNFCMATAVGNAVGYRTDDEPIADYVFRMEYPNAHITKDWNKFRHELGKYK
jgi:hypothetical protein